VNGAAQYSVGNGSGTAAQPRHADKKRKVQSTQYEPVYGNNNQSYSSTQTPHLNGTYGSPTTVSAHSSTASVNGTTAGTSLGSNVSVKDYATAAVAVANGQKRKRVTRASQAAAAAANTLDAFASYHPPPKPPIKAKEVYVQPIQDVSSPCILDPSTFPTLQKVPVESLFCWIVLCYGMSLNKVTFAG
jgi:dual-specificity kinase